MSAQIIPFLKAKKRGPKVKRGPCAEVRMLPAATQGTRDLTSAQQSIDRMFNDFLVKRGIVRDIA